MKAFTRQFSTRENLLPISAGITFGIMVLLFILAQILYITGLLEEEPPFNEKMQVFELVKLKFTPPVKQKIIHETAFRPQNTGKRRIVRRQPTQTQPVKRRSKAASLVKDFDPTKYLSNNRAAGRRGRGRTAKQADASVSTNIQRKSSALARFDIPSDNSALQTTLAVSRRVANGGAENTSQINLGSGGSSLGKGFGSDGVGSSGVDFSGSGSGRARRGNGTGSHAGSARISLPSGSGGNDAALDLHALIKWMKAHPGRIPKLVAHDMGHRSGDLSSAVSFRMRGHQYSLFLSCNEIEMLLRICLVDGKEFTLLKDNGIREASNFLILGNVVRNGENIRSLISSRRAPAGTAENFYRIFWSWWLNEQKKMK